MKKNIKKSLTASLIATFALTTALGVSVFAMPKAEADFSDFTFLWMFEFETSDVVSKCYE